MNTSAVLTTSSRLAHLPLQERAHSRSQTEPLIESPERLHKPCLSVDASPRQQLALERDNASDTPSPARPQMKKRSTTLTSIPIRKNHSKKDSPLTKSPSVPTFHIKPDSRDYKSALPLIAPDSLPATPGTPLLRVSSNASTADSRSPSQKRAPASHSSYGVETSNGPPPSFTTQRTLSQDRLWKPSPPEMSNVPQKSNAGSFYEEFDPPDTDMDEEILDHGVDSSPDELDNTSTPRKKVDESIGGQDGNAGVTTAGHSTETLCTGREQLSRGLEVPSSDQGSKNMGNDDRRSEDLFLNIAQADAGGQELMTRSERRKSRIGATYTPASRRLSNNHRGEAAAAPTPPTREEQSHHDDGIISSRTETSYQPSNRHSFGLRSAARSAHPLDDSGRQRFFSSGTRIQPSGSLNNMERADREFSPELLSSSNQRTTNMDSATRSYRRSNLAAFRNDPSRSTSEVHERPRYVEQNAPRLEGTDSTMSTASPSTVWDELDELKSRIKKLELTGKLPSSSAAAMSTAERPQTATTTVTTMSSSPRQGKSSILPGEGGIDGVPVTVHPLLHEALRKARPVLSADVYQKLEATASDALQLASVMGAGLNAGNASVIGASSSAERQLRRRADSMCRGLTELTIALSARPKTPPLLQPFRPSSREASSTFGHTTPPTTSYSVDSNSRYKRRFSNDPEDARPSAMARVQSRLENRRASLLQNSMVNSPQEYASDIAVHTPASVQSQNQLQPSSSSRLNRAATRLRGRRATGGADGADDSENDSSPSVRPVSRARTDVSLRHRSARDRTSLGREYTSSHPLPSFVRKGTEAPAERSPSVMASSALPTRRSYLPSNTTTNTNGSIIHNSPATPRDNIQPGYRRYVSSGVTRGSPSSSSLHHLSSTEQTPENVTVQRGSASGSRRTLGLTSRLGQVGSFVNGRLRAAKAERERQESLQGGGQQQQKTPSPYGLARLPSRQGPGGE